MAATSAAATLRPVWQPNGPVNAMLLQGSTLYIAGSFSALSSPSGLSSVARANIAAIDWAAGTPTAWNPGVDGPVHALTSQGGSLYIGGSFANAGGAAHSNAASLNTGSNSANPWTVNTNGAVRAMAVTGLSVFLGGDFSLVNGVTRTALAGVDDAVGTLSAFDPALSGTSLTVRALSISGNLLYAGGAFSAAGVSPRASLAAFNKTNGALDPWSPSSALAANPWVLSSFVQGGLLWLGGDFSGTLGGATVNRVAAINLTTSATTWAPQGTDAPVLTLQSDGAGRVHLGGSFANADSVVRRLYASYFQSSPVLESAFSADLNTGGSELRALWFNGGEVAFGGAFSQVDGQNSNNLAIITLPALGPVPTVTSTRTPTLTVTPSATITSTGTLTPSSTPSVTITLTSSSTPVVTATPTATPTAIMTFSMTPTRTLVVTATPAAPEGPPYIYPQPGPCAALKAAVYFPMAGTARLRFLSVRGTVLGAQDLQATTAGWQRIALDCEALKPGLVWMESQLDLIDGSQRNLPRARFIVQVQ